MFSTKGLVEIDDTSITEDELMEIALEAGAEDIKHEGKMFVVVTEPGEYETVRRVIKSHGISPALAQITRIPSTNIPIDETTGRKVLGLINALEDHDDVVNVYANYDIADNIMTKILAEI
jgi:transcriptional/translational regulatory protein YebC/TACO1